MPQGPGPRGRGRNSLKNINDGIFFGSRKKTISDFASTFRNVAKTSHFQLEFDGFSRSLRNYLNERGVKKAFINEIAGLLCYRAQIPGSSSNTVDNQSTRTGIIEQFATKRVYDRLTFNFYVDNKYQLLTFLQSWIEYIHNGSETRNKTNMANDNYFFRNNYPNKYKISSATLHKFDNDYRYLKSYTFYNLFPVSITPIEVDYSSSQILKLSANFSYERYITEITNSGRSFDRSLGESIIRRLFGI